MKLFRKTRGFTLVEIMIVVAIIGILIAIAVPGFVRARSQSRMKACQENLVKIDGAKEQWALETNQGPSDTPTENDLTDSGSGSGYLKKFPREPVGGTYTISQVGVNPTCSTGLAGHSVTDIGEVITAVE